MQRALLCPHCGFQSPTAEHAAHHLIVTCPRRLVHCPSSSHQNCKYSKLSSSSRAILRKMDLQHHMDLECEGKDFACQECGKNDFENFSTWNAHVYPFCASSIPPPCPLCNELLVLDTQVGGDDDDDDDDDGGENNKIDSRSLLASHLITCAGNYLMSKRREPNLTSSNSMSSSSPQQQSVPQALRSSVETVANEAASKKNQQPVFRDPRSLFFFDDDDYGHSVAPSTRHNSPVNQQQQQQNQFDRKSTSPRTGILNQAMINGGISFFAGANSPSNSKKSPRIHVPSPTGVPASLAELMKVNSVSEEENNKYIVDGKKVDDVNNHNEKESSPIIFGSWVTEDQKRNKLFDNNNNNNSKDMSKNNNMIDSTCVSQIRKNENRLMQDHYVSPPQHIFVKQQQQHQDGADVDCETIYQKQQESEVVSSVSRKRFLKPNDKVGNFESNNLGAISSSSSRDNAQEAFVVSGGGTQEMLNNGNDFEDAFSPSPRISDAVIVSKILFGTTSSTSMPSQNHFANVSKTPTFSSRKNNMNHKQLQETKTYSSLYTKKQQQQDGESMQSFTMETTQNESKSLLPSAIVPVFFTSSAKNKFTRTMPTTSGAVTPSSTATAGFSSRRPQTKLTPPPSSKSAIAAATATTTTTSRTPRVSSPLVATATNKNGNSISVRNNNNNNNNSAAMSRTASNSSAFSATSIRRTSSAISNASASSNTNQNGATKRQPFSALLNMSLVSAVNNANQQTRTGRNY